nr:MAG TPA: hypothetical protein [Caudoviricetes sp.]DAU98466.1 MAG TPA: hypothetical protein [Caudoviricetes sp.]DAX96248.1 MAG TPA: hypothetical protein [Caudoviricetes sp.]
MPTGWMKPIGKLGKNTARVSVFWQCRGQAARLL